MSLILVVGWQQKVLNAATHCLPATNNISNIIIIIVRL